MGRNSTEAAQATRQKIVIAALDLYSAHGYSKTSFQDIADRIGLTKGAVYGHFKTKPALLLALIDFGLGQRHDAVCRPEGDTQQIESLAQFRELYLDSIILTLTEPELRRFEFFIGFQVEWSIAALEEMKTALSEIREGPLELMGKALSELRERGEISDETPQEACAFALAAFWKGSVRIGLLGLESPEQIRAHAAQCFDRLLAAPTTD
jgi:AcrR family transcriptional regulator